MSNYISGEGGGTSLGLSRTGLPLLLWNVAVATAVALAACVVLLGRTLPTRATLGWALTWTLFFFATLVWLAVFSRRLGAHRRQEPAVALLPTLTAVEGPLFFLSVAGCAAIYLSDWVNHQIAYFLQPTPAVVLLLAVLATVVLQDTSLRDEAPGWAGRLRLTLASCRRWALPLSLLLLGLLQGSSYLWVIGNDFTRYWAISDALGSLAGYPASVNQPSYLEGGMYRYSIEMAVFPTLLLLSFNLLGHTTLGAHAPAFVANTVLPVLLYGFYHKAGFSRPLAFAAATTQLLFPFFRLYTLNAPVPDAIFVTLLVSTGYIFLHLLPDRRQDAETRRQGDAGTPPHPISPWERIRALAANSERSTQHSALAPWIAFGLLGGLTSVGRPEGLVFVGMMGLALLPNLFRLRLYLAGAAFLAVVAPFSLVMMTTFGIPWPRNAGDSFGLENIAGNLDWMHRMSLRWYADAFGLSTTTFVSLVALLVAAGAVGTLWMARCNWQLALLPMASAVHAVTVFTVDPRVSGVDQWFDFFRHLSYGIPFAVLPLFFLATWGTAIAGKKPGSPSLPLGEGRGENRSRLPVPPSLRPRAFPSLAVALLALLFSAYQLYLLSRPSQTWGGGASQLLTSDVWVSFPDLIANRYPLPRLPFVHREGVLMIDPDFEYIPRHLESVRTFFEPYSAINTGRGGQYELSSLLVLLFGALFAFGKREVSKAPGNVRTPRSDGDRP